MALITGVRFRKSSKIYYFDPTDNKVHKGDHVIVETARGIEYGTVVLGPEEVPEDKVVMPLKPLIRVATPEDADRHSENEKKEKEAFEICFDKIKKHGLEMKLIDSEYTFDRNKLLFYFTADGRIDFRELVKDLASIFRTRIELRQIGVRDETKLLGGMAICGRPLCCHTFLSDFAPVSIKMAKEQGLSLNPTQISGVCGRLMCCLKNEQEAYEELNRSLPSIGSLVKTADGYIGEVQSTNVLKQLVKVMIQKNGEREVCEYPVSKLFFKDHKNLQADADENMGEELVSTEELKQLEPQDKEELANENKKHSYRHINKRPRGARPDPVKREKREPRDRYPVRSKSGYNHQEQSRQENTRYQHTGNKQEHFHEKKDWGHSDHTRDDNYRNSRKRRERMSRDSLNPDQRPRENSHSGNKHSNSSSHLNTRNHK